ncbi:MAG: pilus assembly protein PilM [bacterium]
MPRAKKCLGVDIGCAAIKVAELSLEKEGLRIVSLASCDLATTNSQEEYQAHVLKSLKELLKANKISTRQGVFCLPGQSVFIRRVKLPRTTEERLAKIVRYEARQQIPFPAEQTILQYQVFEAPGTSDEVEVLLVAIKKDHLSSFMKMVEKTGIQPVEIDVSSLALYNFHLLDNTDYEKIRENLEAQKKKGKKKEKGKTGEKPAAKGLGGLLAKLTEKGKKKGEGAAGEAIVDLGVDEEAPPQDAPYEEIKAYLNIGGGTMDLAISQPNRPELVGFTRSVPCAGKDFTRAIRHRLGLESVEQAEEIKRNQVAVLATALEMEASPRAINRDASEEVTATVDRLVAELRRSLDFYISQPDGVAVDALVISGGSARLPYLDAYLEEKLGLPVQIVREPANKFFVRGDKIPADLDFCPFLVAIGLGLGGLGLGGVKIDFLPEEMKSIREFKKKNIEVVVLLAIILGMVGFSANIGDASIGVYSTQADQYEVKIGGIQGQQKAFEDAKTNRELLAKRFDILGQAIPHRGFWLDFLVVLLRQKPPEILITLLALGREGEVTIQGQTENQNSAANFTTNLKQLSAIIESAELTSIDQVPSKFFNKQVYQFIIKMKVKEKYSQMVQITTPTPVGATPGANLEGEVYDIYAGEAGAPGEGALPGAPQLAPEY